MEAKTFEVRDKSTFIPVLAVRLKPHGEKDRYLLGRAGYGTTRERQEQHVILYKIDGGEGFATFDPQRWNGPARTMPVAHQHIVDNWDRLESGAVVDVEFVLRESKEPKKSEAETAPL